MPQRSSRRPPLINSVVRGREPGAVLPDCLIFMCPGRIEVPGRQALLPVRKTQFQSLIAVAVANGRRFAVCWRVPVRWVNSPREGTCAVQQRSAGTKQSVGASEVTALEFPRARVGCETDRWLLLLGEWPIKQGDCGVGLSKETASFRATEPRGMASHSLRPSAGIWEGELPHGPRIGQTGCGGRHPCSRRSKLETRPSQCSTSGACCKPSLDQSEAAPVPACFPVPSTIPPRQSAESIS